MSEPVRRLPDAPHGPIAEGCDYSFAGHISPAILRAATPPKTFVVRYLSHPYPPYSAKAITKPEADQLLAGHIELCLVWEADGRDGLGGHDAGARHAAEALKQADALGLHGIPVYFAPADYDCQPADYGKVGAYFDGAASVIGRARTGGYLGYGPLKAVLDAGKIVWAWQTYAWSYGHWDGRAHLQQYQNGVALGGTDVDLDRAMYPDFGQWPRPPHGPWRHVVGQNGFGAGMSLAELAAARHTTEAHLLAVTRAHATPAEIAALDTYQAAHLLKPGTVIYTTNQ